MLLFRKPGYGIAAVVLLAFKSESDCCRYVRFAYILDFNDASKLRYFKNKIFCL